MYIFYSFLLFLSLTIYIPLYFVRIKLFRGESLYLKERLRLRLPVKNRQKRSLWIHAVSVGEVLSLQNLIKQIKKKHPDWIIHFSSLTNSGIRMAKEKLIEADNIFFAPFDFARIVKRFFKSLKPDVFILAESEFWPNLLREANRHTKGVILINGRISDCSLKKYTKIRFLIKKILKNINLFLVQTEKDKESLKKIGVNSSQVEVAGNLKTEVNLPLLNNDELLKLKRSLSIAEGKKVVIAGSTRKGEEEKLLDAYTKAREIKEDILLILAPRHPQRTDEIEKICQNLGFKVIRRTSVLPITEWDVLVLDTIGELPKFYALSDVAFVGGSLIPWGGHNLLEPAFYEKPVFFGPHMENFSFLAEKFIHSGAARVVYKEEDLVRMFLAEEEKNLEEMGNKAKETLDSLQGATEKTIRTVEALMEKP